MRATAYVPGSCGELVQGLLGESYFLITCPIDKGSQVTVTLERGKDYLKGPAGRNKALHAVRLTLEFLRIRAGALVEIENPLPVGKGLASSTADVAAAAVATALAAGRELTLGELARIVVQVEPSDGVFLPGISLFEHVSGKRWEYLGEPPPLDILIVDLGGAVDTLAFNRRPDLWELNRAKEKWVREATRLVKEGLSQGNAALIARGATLSAWANQRILPKEELPVIFDIALSSGALGINIAHSGTVVGILYEPGTVDQKKLKALLKERYPFLSLLPARVVSGGVKVGKQNLFLPPRGELAGSPAEVRVGTR